MIHIFGCSLSHGILWSECFDHTQQFKIHAVPAGDNTTQYRRFQDCVLNNTIQHDDCIIWQVTYPNRLGFRLSPQHDFYQAHKDDDTVKHNFHSIEPNILDKSNHVDYVAFNEKWYETFYYAENINQELQSLLFHMLIAKQKVKNKILVWFAQSDMTDIIDDITGFLKQHAIKFIDKSNSIIDWTKRNNLPMDKKDLHPTIQSYNMYVNQIIKPAMEQF
tara:strand:+ start:105 stop:761 length:657 start_codon:yes stop_codon:yes gene_type:complete